MSTRSVRSARIPRHAAPSARETAMRRAMMARDAGLARISSVTRWVAVGVLGLSGALALIASHAFHGHTTTSTGASSPALSQSSGGSGGLSPAASAPTVTPAQPVVVSGGS